MKHKRIPSLLCLFTLGLAVTLPSACGIFYSPPEHAGHIPKDTWMIITLFPEELIEKTGYEDFVKSPLLKEMPNEASAVFKVLSLDDLEGTGVALDEPVYAFISGNPDKGGSFGLTFLLDDGEAFADIIEDALALIQAGGEKGLSQSSKDGVHQITHKKGATLLYDDDKVLFTYGVTRPEKLFEEPNDTNDLPPVIQAHLERSFDAGVAIDFDNLASMAKSSGGGEAAMFSQVFGSVKGGGVALELSSDDGSIEIKAYSSYGEDNDMEDLAGDGVDSDLLDVIPDDAIAAATLSLNLKNMVAKVLPQLAEAIPFPGFPKDGDFTIPNTKFTIDDVVTAIPGDFSFALLGIPTGPEPPEFVLAIKTADADSKEYEKVISDVLAEAEGELKREGISIEEKDNLLLIGTAAQRSILREGESKHPVSGHKEDILSEGYVGFCLDVEELIDALPIKASEMNEGEKLLLGGAKKLNLLSMWAEESGDGYEATIELTFKDEDVNGLRQVVDFIEELAQFEIKRVRTRAAELSRQAQERADSNSADSNSSAEF